MIHLIKKCPMDPDDFGLWQPASPDPGKGSIQVSRIGTSTNFADKGDVLAFRKHQSELFVSSGENVVNAVNSCVDDLDILHFVSGYRLKRSPQQKFVAAHDGEFGLAGIQNNRHSAESPQI